MVKVQNESLHKQVPAGEAYENAHEVEKGDPKTDGPYLDDLRAAQEEEYRRQRNHGVSQVRHEDESKKKDVFVKGRAKSQKQHDDNRADG